VSSAHKPPGTSPGTLVHVGERRADFSIEVHEYDAAHLEHFQAEDSSECHRFHETDEVTWVHVTGLHDVEKIGALAGAFSIHPLVTEDILNTHQRTKLEEFPDYVFAVVDIPITSEIDSDATVGGAKSGYRIGHFALLLTKWGVITFSEEPTPIFDGLRKRLENPNGRLRTRGPDYLAWAILDSIIDHLFVVLQDLDDHLDEVENELASGRSNIQGAEIFQARQQANKMYRVVRPLRELAGAFLRSDSGLIAESTRKYIADFYDQAIHALETSEALREHASALRDYHMSMTGNRLNEVMMVLTCISTIFLPLGFLAGVYGMNFEFIPELQWKWGYPLLWLVFLTIAGSLVAFFVRRKWLG